MMLESLDAGTYIGNSIMVVLENMHLVPLFVAKENNKKSNLENIFHVRPFFSFRMCVCGCVYVRQVLASFLRCFNLGHKVFLL